MNYIVYILRCNNNSLYTGYTTDLARRYAAHLHGQCKYTRSFKPIEIAVNWLIQSDKADAMRVERYIKTLTRQAKEALILSPHLLSETFGFVTHGEHICVD